MRRRSQLVLLAGIAGPGLLAGLSDDDPAGITTYSILGADHGYRLIWVLLLSTIALILFHELGARMGVVTGQGLIGLIRERHGVRPTAFALTALVVANIGTTCAEFAGVAASLELAGVSRYLSVPSAAVAVSLLVLKGGFKRIEHVLLGVATVFGAYIVAGVLAHPAWSQAARGAVVPSLPLHRDALLIATATIGTTLAPWGLAFIQSYAVDKRLRPRDMGFVRVDVITGAVMTGLIGLFIVVACAATLHASGRSIHDAADAAVALKPLAGSFASTLFGAGLLGAALLAASILPLATAYSVTEAVGHEAALDDSFAQARGFYLTYGLVVSVAVILVLIPGAPLISIMYLSQTLNAVLLVPLLWFIYRLCGDRRVMGSYVAGPQARVAYGVTIALLSCCVVTLGMLSLTG